MTLRSPANAQLPCDSELRSSFHQLCRGSDGDRTTWLSFADWMGWNWLRDRVGPPGSMALLTPEAAEKIWERVVAGGGAGFEEFLELARAVDAECMRATAIQSLIRGRKGRRKAELASSGRPCNAIPGVSPLAPFNPTPECAIVQALDALEVGPGDVVYDIGCGDGRFLVAAARRGASCVGVEYDSQLVNRARENASGAGVGCQVLILHEDAATVDLAGATKIFAYLVPSGLQRMQPAFEAALRRGVPIASYTFSLCDWEASVVLNAPTRAPECSVRLYQFPAPYSDVCSSSR